MRAAPPWAVALFVLATVGLIAAALLLGRAADGDWSAPVPAPRASSLPASMPPALARVRREEAKLRAVAVRFLTAYLRYEVGESAPAIELGLRRSSSGAFARGLLAMPPRPAGGSFPEPAELGVLDVVFLDASLRRAMLSGVAHRASGPEQFSFLLARRAPGWLVVGVGQ